MTEFFISNCYILLQLFHRYKKQGKVTSLQWNETHNRGGLKLDTWRLSFTYIKNQKHSRMKIFAKKHQDRWAPDQEHFLLTMIFALACVKEVF